MSKILIVDDDESLLGALERLLGREGYEVSTAATARKGLALMDKALPDLLILDIQMPGISGISMLKEISGSDGKPRCPVLVMSGRAHMEEFFQNLDVDGFIEKPTSSDTLIGEIERILAVRGARVAAAEATAHPVMRRVLVVNDESWAGEKIVRSFAKAGVVAQHVSDAAEVMGKALTLKPDAIVIDRIMRDLNGDRIAALLEEMPSTREIPIVLFESNGTLDLGERLKAKHRNIVAYVEEDTPAAITGVTVRMLDNMPPPAHHE